MSAQIGSGILYVDAISVVTLRLYSFIHKAHHQAWLSQTPGVLVPVSSYGHCLVYWVGRAQVASRSWDPQYHLMAELKHTYLTRTVRWCLTFSLGRLSLP
jgi:hypothetical protein